MNRTTKPLAVALALSLSALSAGCHLIGPEEHGWWYCEPSGCYSCTEYGCDGLPEASPRDPFCTADGPCAGYCTDEGSPCTSPERPPGSCDVTADCRSGYVCTRGLCVPGKPGPCKESEACGDGAFCDEGACENTGRCSGDAECERFGSGYRCDPRGTCAPVSEPPVPVEPPCAAADACSGDFCASGACGSCPGGDCGTAATCLLDRHCGAGRVCLDGHCTGICSTPGTSEGCGSGQICKSGVCAPDLLSCTSDVECGGGGAVCVNNRCHATCTATGACDNPLDVCSGVIETASFTVRICRPDDAAQLECKVSKDCEGGETCVNGVCRTACSEPEECAACEDGPVCGPGGYCMTAIEAEPQCSASGGCAEGLDCLGGQCLAL